MEVFFKAITKKLIFYFMFVRTVEIISMLHLPCVNLMVHSTKRLHWMVDSILLKLSWQHISFSALQRGHCCFMVRKKHRHHLLIQVLSYRLGFLYLEKPCLLHCQLQGLCVCCYISVSLFIIPDSLNMTFSSPNLS